MNKTRLLIVEDEGLVASDLRHRLLKMGYDVIGVVPSADEALESVTADKPDLALMDIHISGVPDGTELAKQFKDAYDVPVIFLTAFSDDQTLNRAKQACPYGYLLKPFSQQELKSNIEMAIFKKSVEKRKERMLGTLQRLLDRFRSLDGLVPICSCCKKIRNEDGGWEDIESYIAERSRAEFSHGICPTCYKRKYQSQEDDWSPTQPQKGEFK